MGNYTEFSMVGTWAHCEGWNQVVVNSEGPCRHALKCRHYPIHQGLQTLMCTLGQAYISNTSQVESVSRGTDAGNLENIVSV